MDFDVIHSIRNKRSGMKGWMTLKLDMSKAYDRVEWSFLETVMRRMGFINSWINAMIECIGTARCSFLINGET